MRLLSAPTLAKTLVRYPSEFRRNKSRGCKISLVAKRSSCPLDLLPKCNGKRTFKQLIQGTRLDLVLLRKMSVIGPENITDADCERGRVTQRPPISYAQYKYPKWLTEPDTVKVRLPKGDQYVCDLMHDTLSGFRRISAFWTTRSFAHSLTPLPRNARSSSKT